MPLRIAAKIDRVDQAYFDTTIRPLLNDPLVEFVGEISETQKSDFLGRAAALLFPIDWVEPFGLVMIEAMACGTPVIAWPWGSVPEIVEEGVSGFVVESVADAFDICATPFPDLRWRASSASPSGFERKCWRNGGYPCWQGRRWCRA